LLIVGRDRIAGDSSRSLDPGAVLLKAGRPVLVVPPDIQSLMAERVVIGWKDTREARRAVRDSLPLLRKATKVTIVEIAEPRDRDQSRLGINDVAQYLTRHQVKSVNPATSNAIGSVAGGLVRVAREQKADLIVAGGYGHNRLGEWLFGGVTEELFQASPMCCLLSH
jgi:nucleotide-binding universal stress UspA family protein